MNHPYLFAGFNTAPNNGDEVDGAGVASFPAAARGTGVSPEWTSTLTQIEILIMTEDMTNFFITGCPDLVIRCEPDTVVFPRETETVVVRGKAA